MENKIFDVDNIDLKLIQDKIKANYKYMQLSLLGGKDRACLLIRISLDKKEDWINNIYHNSRYYILSLNINGELDNFSRELKIPKIRNKKFNTLNEAIDYINIQINKIQ